MKVDIAILTVREDEFTAVRRRFQTERKRIPDGRTYLIGEVKTKKHTYTIAIARCSEQGTDASQKLAHHIIQNLDPRLILVVGIAGGVPRDEFTLGDVVVSTRIANPNVDAWHPDGTTDYTTRGGPPHPLVENIVGLLPGEPQLAGWTATIQLERPTVDPEQANIAGDDEWRERVRQSLNWHFGDERNRGRPPTFTTGPIFSSNHLMKDPARLKEILKTNRSILAVEMEVAGVYEAAQGIDRQYPVMAIRGISDVVGLQRDRRWTEYACQAAAAFTYAFIMTDPLDPPLNSASFQMPAVPSEMSSAQLRGSEPSLDTQHSLWHQRFLHWLQHVALLIGVLSRWPSREKIFDRQRLASIQQDRQFCLRRLLALYQQMHQESLQQKLLIELRLVEQRGTVQNAATFYFRPASETARRLPTGTTIRQIYDLSAQQLLILGAPGAGKSTLLIELAEQLTVDAQQYTSHLIPLLLPLSTWPQKRLSLQDWMIEQFTDLYTIPRHLCQLWVQNRQILPLLDGLDEMKEADYIACIVAINAYHQTCLGPMVVCSRSDEYTRAAKAERLKLSNAVEVLPLVPEQIDEVLTNAGKPLEALQVEYKRNQTLRELATSPLFLSILQLTYWNQPVQALSTQWLDLQRQVWKNYLDRMLFSKSGQRHYSPQDSLHWLQWLAQQMSAHGRTLFMLMDLTSSWLPKRSRFWHRWSVRIIVGLTCALVIGLFSALGVAQNFGLVIGLISALIVARVFVLDVFSLRGKKRRALSVLMEASTWSQKETRSEQVIAMTFGLGLGLMSGLGVTVGFGPVVGLIAGLIAGLCTFLYEGPFDMYPAAGSLLDQMHQPSMKRELTQELIFGLVHALVNGLVFLPFVDPIIDLYRSVNNCLLRFWLRCIHCLPWNTQQFFEEMHSRIILRRVGGSYQFLHRLLQDYLESDVPPAPVNPNVTPPSPQKGRKT